MQIFSLKNNIFYQILAFMQNSLSFCAHPCILPLRYQNHYPHGLSSFAHRRTTVESPQDHRKISPPILADLTYTIYIHSIYILSLRFCGKICHLPLGMIHADLLVHESLDAALRRLLKLLVYQLNSSNLAIYRHHGVQGYQILVHQLLQRLAFA